MNDQFDFVKRACSGILLVDYSVSKPSYEAQLPKGMSAAIVAKIAAKTGEGKVSTPITKIPLFGQFQKEFSETVLRPLGQFRNNLIYTRLEIDGGRMFTVAEFPEAYPAIEAEAEKIQAAIAEVGDERLSAWCEAGISSAIRTYEGVFPGVENWVRDKLPSAAEFAEATQINVGLPRKLSPDALEDVSLPAEYLAKIQARTAAAAQEKLEKARTQAIAAVRRQLDLVAKQLGEGKRYHESLLTNLKATTETLSKFVAIFDADPRLTELVAVIDEKIAGVASTEVWKNSESASLVSKETAVKVSDQLKKLETREVPAMQVASAANVEIAEGGLLGELL